MIWNVTVTGTNSNDYEINTPVTTANGGGTFIHFKVRASLDAARRFPARAPGASISVELAVTGNDPYGPGGAGDAEYQPMLERITLRALLRQRFRFRMEATMRTVVWGTTLWIFLDNQQAWAGTIPLYHWSSRNWGQWGYWRETF